MKKLEDLDVVIIAAAHNNWEHLGDDLTGLPLKWGDPGSTDRKLDGLTVVGGIDALGRLGAHSPHADWLVMAPAFQIFTIPGEGESPAWGDVGNSFGMFNPVLNE